MAKIIIQLEEWQGFSDEVATRLGHDLIFQKDFKSAGADILIADYMPLDPDDLGYGTHTHAVPSVRGIVRPGAGWDGLPMLKCKAMGIVCAYTPNAPSRAVAELTIGLMIDAVRGITRNQKQGKWNRYMGRELRSLTLGVIGLGRIGKRVVNLARPLMGTILGCDPVSDTTFDETHDVLRVNMKNLLLQSDVITLHVPKTGNEMLIDWDELGAMDPRAVLINTSRGGIVNEPALWQRLRDKPEMTACMDVFGVEPYGGTLGALPNFVRTCHMASMTLEARDRMEREALEAAVAIIDGKKPRWVLPPEKAIEVIQQK